MQAAETGNLRLTGKRTDLAGLDFIVRDALLSVARKFEDSPRFVHYERDLTMIIFHEMATRCPELVTPRQLAGTSPDKQLETMMLKAEWKDDKGDRTDLLIIDLASLELDRQKNPAAHTLVEIEVKPAGSTRAALLKDVEKSAKSAENHTICVAFSLFDPASDKDRERWGDVLADARRRARKAPMLSVVSNLGMAGHLESLPWGPTTIPPKAFPARASRQGAYQT